MPLHEQLGSEFVAGHPAEAAAVLEQLPVAEITAVLMGLSPELAASLGERMAPAVFAGACELSEGALAERIVPRLSIDAALPVLRRLEPATRESVIAALPRNQARAIRAVIDFEPGTAGALMDPKLLSCSADLTAAEARALVERESALIHYHLYVIDRDRILVGVLNLQELLQADAQERLEAIMSPPTQRLEAHASRVEIVRHPGWRKVYSLPVVDGDGRFLGAIRYPTYRKLEAELGSDDFASEAQTIRALGELFGAGMGGIVDALAVAITPRDDHSSARMRAGESSEP